MRAAFLLMMVLGSWAARASWRALVIANIFRFIDLHRITVSPVECTMNEVRQSALDETLAATDVRPVHVEAVPFMRDAHTRKDCGLGHGRAHVTMERDRLGPRQGREGE